VTVSIPKRLTGSPRNAICVWGEATRAPGIGYTLTALTTGSRAPARVLALVLVLALARVLALVPARAPTPQPLAAMHTPSSVTADALARRTDRLLDLIDRGTAEAVRRTDDGTEELGQVGGSLAVGQDEPHRCRARRCGQPTSLWFRAASARDPNNILIMTA
jgi:hypothetical protein